MKRIMTVGRALLAALVVGATAVAMGETLTQSQWMSQIGPSVTDYSVLQKTVANLAQSDRVAFTQNALKAVSRLPVSNEEKAAAFVRTAVGCLEGNAGDAKKDIIAEIFADVPVEYLPTVTEELAKRFDQQANGLSDADFKKIAKETMDAATARNAKTDEPSVRNSFAALAFLRGSKSPDALKNDLIAQLPDDRQRNLASTWIPAVLDSKGKDYSALTTAADVDADSVVAPSAVDYSVGQPGVDRLLANLNQASSVAGAKAASTSDSPEAGATLSGSLSDVGGAFTEDTVFDSIKSGTGLLRTPAESTSTESYVVSVNGYQNQVITVVTKSRGGEDGTSHKHRGHKAE